MQEMSDCGSSLTPKCNVITNVTTPSILAEKPKQNSKQERKIHKKPYEFDMNVSNVKHDPLPRFLVTELHQWSFQIDGQIYPSDTDNVAMWQRFVAEHANVSEDLDWEDLEERAHFLNMLYEHCESRSLVFPLQRTGKI